MTFLWVLGWRPSQQIIAVDASSGDNGETLQGTIQYAGEGPIGFRATRVTGNSYTVENQWGGSWAPWHDGGQWVLGDRDGQRVVDIQISGSNGALSGTITYVGEGPIGFQALCQ